MLNKIRAYVRLRKIKHFEYTYREMGHSCDVHTLNTAGSEGWELINIIWVGKITPMAYFKREL